ncbi:MAG: hypothetical protein ACD_79C01248G0003 [uncultured bacterium]|nr:MAG: hypothetical protein ACD_79C01248G0003 [uncultured bacterium]
MTVQLATRIDPKKKKILDELHKKTHIPIRNLTEKAITLLDEYYKTAQKSFKEEVIENNFIELLDYSMKKYDQTYKKLAE